MATTSGYDRFEHLTDKSAVLLCMLEEEANKLEYLRIEVRHLREEKKSLISINDALTSRVSKLEEKREHIDSRASQILGALHDSHLLDS